MSANIKILIVDDDVYIGDMVAAALTKQGYEPVRAYSGTEALLVLESTKPDVILLDLMLPGLNGEELIKRIKDIPVIVVSAKVGIDDKVTMLTQGAADYITKPFSLAVFRARVGARLRRDGRRKPQKWEMGPYSFNFEKMIYYKDGRPVDLSKTEQKLLRILVENKGRVVTREVLLSQVWTDGTEYVDENALSVNVNRLRKKLESIGIVDFIQTKKGLGYKI